MKIKYFICYLFLTIISGFFLKLGIAFGIKYLFTPFIIIGIIWSATCLLFCAISLIGLIKSCGKNE
jgi:hypothetical protein